MRGARSTPQLLLLTLLVGGQLRQFAAAVVDTVAFDHMRGDYVKFVLSETDLAADIDIQSPPEPPYLCVVHFDAQGVARVSGGGAWSWADADGCNLQV